MEQRNLNHLRNLIHFANIDGEFHSLEKEFIKSVGKRLGLDEITIEAELSELRSEQSPLPENEIRKFVLLDDIMNLMAADGVIQDSELMKCKDYAVQFGFDPAMIDGIAQKIREHLGSENVNAPHLLIKNELFKLTNKNPENEKYS